MSLLITCLGDALFPDVGVATVRLLRRRATPAPDRNRDREQEDAR